MRYAQIIANLGIFLTLLCAPAAGQTEYGNWIVGHSNDKTMFYAVNQNISGDVLGEFCYSNSKSCLWGIAISTQCIKGSTYPVLINQESGAASLVIVCTGFSYNKKYVYDFNNFDEINSTIKEGGWLGIAFPLAGDEFSVVRFNVDEVAPAIGLMRQLATKAFGKTPATSDQIL